MRYLGLDLGTKTIGLALSDRSGLIASRYRVLHHDNDPAMCLPDLKDIVQTEQVEALVLGFPKNMNNTIGPKGELSLQFKEKLEKVLSIPVYLQDERLSTKSATDMLITADVSRKNRKKVVDSVAATIILQTFLDKEKR